MIQGGGPVYSPVISSDGTIYVHSGGCGACISIPWNPGMEHLYALNPDGSFKWSFQVVGAYSSPAIGADGAIYFGSDDKKFYALSPAGTVKWYFQTGGHIYSSPAVGVDGTIYFGSDDGYFYALNADGTLKWSYLNARARSRTKSILLLL